MSRDSKTDPGFISRWSQRKQAAASEASLVPDSESLSVTDRATDTLPPPPGDEDMPPLESLDESSDYSGFLSERVSEALRKQALRKLFHGAAFNVCDGLDDYAGDYTSFAKLGDIVTADMRHQLAMAEEKLKAALPSEPDPAAGLAEQPPTDRATEDGDEPGEMAGRVPPALPENSDESVATALDPMMGEPAETMSQHSEVDEGMGNG